MQERMEESGLGRLPQYAPLANPYVPYQSCGDATYPAKRGVVRGTLFPGLDLPFLGMVNEGELPNLPLHELQALNFAITELGLYLDTHTDDTEALELFRRYVALYEDGAAQYQEKYGPLRLQCAGKNGRYNWLQSPWPWEYDAKQED